MYNINRRKHFFMHASSRQGLLVLVSLNNSNGPTVDEQSKWRRSRWPRIPGRHRAGTPRALPPRPRWEGTRSSSTSRPGRATTERAKKKTTTGTTKRARRVRRGPGQWRRTSRAPCLRRCRARTMMTTTTTTNADLDLDLEERRRCAAAAAADDEKRHQ